jgi:hypothetical protein
LQKAIAAKLLFQKKIKNIQKKEFIEVSLIEYFFLAFGSMISHFENESMDVRFDHMRFFKSDWNQMDTMTIDNYFKTYFEILNFFYPLKEPLEQTQRIQRLSSLIVPKVWLFFDIFNTNYSSFFLEFGHSGVSF